jgi:DNA-binding MarR family transcriptional regulator
MIFTQKLQRLYELAAMVAVKTRRATQVCVKPFGITADQFGALLVLLRSDGVSQRELAAIMETDTTTAMVICDGLEKRDLARRARDPADRRINRLSITERGRKLMGRVVPAVEKLSAPLTRVLTSEEIDVATPLLGRLAAAAKELAAKTRHGRTPRRG